MEEGGYRGDKCGCKRGIQKRQVFNGTRKIQKRTAWLEERVDNCL